MSPENCKSYIKKINLNTRAFTSILAIASICNNIERRLTTFEKPWSL